MCPKISVVMCCYNAEKYLRESIDSILNQDFEDFEFIIWDDGSTDSTKELIRTYNDSRIRYFYHDNTGLGLALKLACAEAKGDYIARMDADDISLPNRLGIEYEFLKSHKEYVLVSSAVYYIDGDGKIIGRSFPCTEDDILKRILPISNMIVHPMVMMRRDSYNKAGGYIPIKKSQDRLFWSRLAKIGKFSNLITPLGKYRLLDDSLSHNTNPYNPVLYELRKKMILDEEILESDVLLYNNLCNYIKSFTIKKGSNYIHNKSFDEHLYSLLKPLLGQSLSEKIIVGIKNFYYKIKIP